MEKSKFLLINLPIYRLSVVLTWETDAQEIAKWTASQGVKVAPRFERDFKEASGDALGLCMSLDNKYPDMLVWLAKKPSNKDGFHTLYHELYHAVDGISENRNLGDEKEARAYLFEHLVTVCDETFGRR